MSKVKKPEILKFFSRCELFQISCHFLSEKMIINCDWCYDITGKKIICKLWFSLRRILFHFSYEWTRFSRRHWRRFVASSRALNVVSNPIGRTNVTKCLQYTATWFWFFFVAFVTAKAHLNCCRLPLCISLHRLLSAAASHFIVPRVSSFSAWLSFLSNFRLSFCFNLFQIYIRMIISKEP